MWLDAVFRARTKLEFTDISSDCVLILFTHEASLLNAHIQNALFKLELEFSLLPFNLSAYMVVNNDVNTNVMQGENTLHDERK